MQIGRRGYIEAPKRLYHSWLGAWLCVRTTHCHGRPLSMEVCRCGWKARSQVLSQRCACNAISSGLPNASGGGGGRPGVGLCRYTGPALAAAMRLLNGAPGRVSTVAATHEGVGTLPALAGGDIRCVDMTTTDRDPREFGSVKRIWKATARASLCRGTSPLAKMATDDVGGDGDVRECCVCLCQGEREDMIAPTQRVSGTRGRGHGGTSNWNQCCDLDPPTCQTYTKAPQNTRR
jgi:hypothetical protein